MKVEVAVTITNDDGSPFSKSNAEYSGCDRDQSHMIESAVVNSLLALGDSAPAAKRK
jgi:hypothetical protein